MKKKASKATNQQKREFYENTAAMGEMALDGMMSDIKSGAPIDFAEINEMKANIKACKDEAVKFG